MYQPNKGTAGALPGENKETQPEQPSGLVAVVADCSSGVNPAGGIRKRMARVIENPGISKMLGLFIAFIERIKPYHAKIPVEEQKCRYLKGDDLCNDQNDEMLCPHRGSPVETFFSGETYTYNNCQRYMKPKNKFF